MNQSIIESRYATALVKYARETGQGDVLLQEAETLLRQLNAVPELRRAVTAVDDVVSPSQKKALLQGALNGEMSQEMDHFLSLLGRNGRMDMVEDILREFTVCYLKSVGVRKARLISAREPSEELLERLKDLVREQVKCELRIEVQVDPSLIGGFVFDMDDYMLDASVKRQLDIIREQFIQRNRRIV